MTTHRARRVADLLREILASSIRDELRDPRIGFATITEVRLTADLKHARVFVSHLGGAEERDESIRALNRAAPFLRRAVGRQARLKYVPDVVFLADTAVETGRRVEDLLRELHNDAGAPSGPDDHEPYED